MAFVRQALGYLNARRPRPHVRTGDADWIDPSVRLIATREATVELGDRVRVFRHCEILGPVRIGHDTFLNRDVYVREQTVIGDRVAIGPFSRLITDTHELGDGSQRAGERTVDPIHVESGAWLGAGVTVLPGVTIGEGSVVAAGSVVTKDVAPNTMVAGIPARPVKDLPHPAE